MNTWTTAVGIFLASVAVCLLVWRTHTSRLVAWAAWLMTVTAILIAQGNQFKLAHDAQETARAAAEESKLQFDAALAQSNLRFQTLITESDRRFEDLLKDLAKVEKLPSKQRQAALAHVLTAYKNKESLAAAVGEPTNPERGR